MITTYLELARLIRLEVKKLGLSAADEDDLAAEALAKMWVAFREQGILDSGKATLLTKPVHIGYVRSTVQNLARDRWRKLSPEVGLEGEPLDIKDGWKGPSYSEILREVARTLSKEEIQIFRLRIMRGESYEQIAKRLEVSEGTLRMRVSRIKAHLRRELEGLLGKYGIRF